MSNFAIEGLISGFDTTSIIEAMLDIQVRGPIAGIETRIEEETEKFAAFQSVNAGVLSLDIAIQSLNSPTLFRGKEATSSDESVVSVSANSSAEEGTFNLQVNNLATTEQISSNFFASSQSDLGLAGEFIVNGRAVAVEAGDTLATVATKINAANSGAKATVVQTSATQNKLVITATETGANKLEFREVGADAILENLGLVSADPNDQTFDFTVNAAIQGPVSNGFTPAAVIGTNGESFSIRDASGQTTLDVTLSTNPSATLVDIANEINTAATAQNSLISASVILDSGGNERLLLSSDTGIPTDFSDPDNFLSGTLGVLRGIQSEEFDSTTIPIAELLGITGPGNSTLEISDPDLSDSLTVDIDLSTDSLQDIADKINAAAGSSDIEAGILTVDGVSRLEIRTNPLTSGRPLFTSDPNNILNTLGIVDSGFANIDQRGENAQITFNGVKINRESNLVDDVVEGVSFALNQESVGNVTVNVSQDTSNVEAAVESFVKAFNDLNALIEENTFFDRQTGDKGILFGNPAIRQLQNALSSVIANSVPDLPNTPLSELNNGDGVSLGKIKITDRLGNESTIDLLGVETVQDILDAINTDQTLNLTASVSSTGRGINIVDNSGGTGTFKIEEVNNGTTAADLGLLRQIASDQISGGAIGNGGGSTVSKIGLALNTSGGLDFTKTDLSSLLSTDSGAVENLLQAKNVGFVKKFIDSLKVFTAPNTGILDTSTQGITDRIDQFNKQIQRFEDRASVLEKTLRRRFTTVEVSLAQSQQLGDFLSQRLTPQNN